jgi:hypothetical protein
VLGHTTRRRLTSLSGLAVLGLASLSVAALVPAAATGATSVAGASVERTIQDPDIVESSGLARSRYSDTRLWTHNDSGGGTLIYAIGKTGRTTATYELSGASHLDWEGMASAKKNGIAYLFVGDIGDNGSQRSSIFVHRVREPRVGSTARTLSPRTYELRYPDGAHNAETLMVRPGSMRIYVVTKGKQVNGAVYAAPRTLSTTRVNVMKRVDTAPPGLADGVFLDRQRYVLRGYESGWLYRRIGATPIRFPLPLKGESIATAWRRGHVLIGSEGRYSDIWRVPLPRR